MTKHSASGNAMTQFILKIFPTVGALHSIGDELTKDFGLTSSRWQILSSIEHQANTVASIARKVGLTRQAVLRSVDMMQNQGLVSLATNPEHKRASLVVLTEYGKNIHTQIVEKQTKWINELTKNVAIQDITTATAIINLLETCIHQQLALMK